MENTSYALYIAIGTLIAIVLMSILVMSWRQFGSVEKSKDDSLLVKNMAEFNAEYEAYDKKLMYGTDVLSCLNKAQNNNQKYVYNNYYGTDSGNIGSEDREEFFIDVVVTLKSKLHETIKVYKRDDKGKTQRLTDFSGGGMHFEIFNDNSGFSDVGVIYYYFKDGKLYQRNTTYFNCFKNNLNGKMLDDVMNDHWGSGSGIVDIDYIQANTEYHLLSNKNGSSITDKNAAASLSALISTVSFKEQKLSNTSYVSGSNNWYYCSWTSAASDFKTRKFTCKGIHYNEDTGYIDEIKFEEYTGN